MEETGGTVDDYARLSRDYSNISTDALLHEYYKAAKPHLDSEERSFIIEDSFSFDEELDEARDVRKKKLAYKEEVAKAKNYLESLKGKYYEEIKLRPWIGLYFVFPLSSLKANKYSFLLLFISFL